MSGRDLTNLSHEEAVEIIRSAPNPVTFVIQSLLPWVSALLNLIPYVEIILSVFRQMKLIKKKR